MAQTKEKSKKKRSRWLRKRISQPGSPPGLLNFDPTSEPTKIRVVSLQKDRFVDRADVTIGQLEQMLVNPTLLWIDVTGLGTETTLTKIAELIKIHPLAMEDVLNIHHRAKVDQFSDSLFVVTREIDGNDARDSEQISFILKPNVLVSFQQRSGDCWEPIRARMRAGRGVVHKNGVDYLLYCLLDAIIDSYFPFIDQLADQLDHIDEAITANATDDKQAFAKLHSLRSQLLALRRIIRPHRDMINQLIRDDFPMITPETKIFLRDCYDHVMHVSDSAETYNEASSGIRDYHMSMVSNRMNEVMKVLTIMSSIFIPLSFIAGLYGMNFDTKLPGNMPELDMPYAYEMVLGCMVALAVGLLAFFRVRRWI